MSFLIAVAALAGWLAGVALLLTGESTTSEWILAGVCAWTLLILAFIKGESWGPDGGGGL